MNLVIDIGNSSAKLAIFDSGKIVWQQKTEQLSGALITQLKARFEPVGKAIISSVAGIAEDVMQTLSAQIPFFVQLDHTTPLPVENGYGTPETLGLDRLAAAAGASFLYPCQDILVIDTGTAITLDIIDAKGRFLGGNISPGIRTRFRALNHFTRNLPLCDKTDQWPLIGQTTTEAIQSGVLNGVIFELDGMIDAVKKDFPKIITVIKREDSNFFDRKLKNAIFAQFEVTLIGLNYILEYNYNAYKK